MLLCYNSSYTLDRCTHGESQLSMVNLNVWSGPRCCSTALLYSFASREDTTVYDEPLYACYLQKSGASRPYSAQVRQRYKGLSMSFRADIRLPGHISLL